MLYNIIHVTKPAVKMAIPNEFILLHNNSVTPGVHYIRLSSAKEYRIVHDMRTHSLYLFTDHNVMMQMNSEKSKSKLIHVLRDKFNEADRTFIPKYFVSVTAYEEYNKIRPIEQRPATITIKDNKPCYSRYPILAVKGYPLLTLLLRIEKIFNFIVTQCDMLDIMMALYTNAAQSVASNIGAVQSLNDSELLNEIVKRSGEKVIDSIRSNKTKSVTVIDLMPRVESPIPFEPFNIISESRFIITFDELDNIIRTYDRLPQYFIIENRERITLREIIKVTSCIPGYQLVNAVCSDGTLYEVFTESMIMLSPNTLSYTNATGEVQPLFVMLTTSALLQSVPQQVITVVGSYQPPSLKKEVVIPFRAPVSCKMANLDAESDWEYPCFVQRKLDGNRTIVYSLLGGRIIRYYSRSGYQLSKNFNKQFDSDIAELSKVICKKLNKPDADLYLDFECYAHGIIHEVIAGLCNAIQLKEGFELLKLHLLSCFCLNDIYTYEQRKRNYTASVATFEEIIPFCNSLPLKANEFDTLTINETRLITSTGELKDFMRESVSANYEGLVVYPLKVQYVFGHDRLIKLKKIFDGEVRVLGYKESPTEQGAIGSVLVESLPYLGIRMLTDTVSSAQANQASGAQTAVSSAQAAVSSAQAAIDGTQLALVDIQADQVDGTQLALVDTQTKYVTYYITASLKLEHRAGSMTSELFKQCICKYFTIICDSFSQTGIPMHARFKAPLHPNTARLDVDQ